jgi:hypothetical protein
MAKLDLRSAPVTQIKVLDASTLPFPLPQESRKAVISGLFKTYTGVKDIPAGSLGTVTPMPLGEQIQVICIYLFALGLPLTLVPVTIALTAGVASKVPLCVFLVALAILALYPMKQDDRAGWIPSRALHLMYKYNSYKVVYPSKLDPLIARQEACIGSGGPHGVFPVGALLSIPAMNDFMGINFKGGMASVVTRTPGLRSLTSVGCTDVGKKNILAEIKGGTTVGIVSDGVNGIFAGALDSNNVECLAIADKKGIAKLALEQGYDVSIVHWFGNSKTLVPIIDPFGIFKTLSRKLRASIFFFWGRFFLPIPTRATICMVIGDAVYVKEKVAKPSQEQIDELHGRICAAHKKLFDDFKKGYGNGYEDKELRICS